jgi:hypothetical protein
MLRAGDEDIRNGPLPAIIGFVCHLLPWYRDQAAVTGTFS